MLAVIPARGGSKRIPRKNVQEVAGKPLIAHTIDQANEVEHFEEVIVSTDDEEIADVAESYGGSVPFRRPDELATDETPGHAVISHALEWFQERDREFESVCQLQVTCPLRTRTDVVGSIERFTVAEAASLVSVSEYQSAPQFALTEAEDGTLVERFEPAKVFTDEYIRSQDIDELLYPNGAIYLATVEAWRDHENFYTPNTIGYRMPPERSFDIDEAWELDLVECLLTQRE